MVPIIKPKIDENKIVTPSNNTISINYFYSNFSNIPKKIVAVTIKNTHTTRCEVSQFPGLKSHNIKAKQIYIIIDIERAQI